MYLLLLLELYSVVCLKSLQLLNACEINLLVFVNIRWPMSFLYQDTPVYPSATSLYPAQAVLLYGVESQVPPASTKFCRPVVHGSYI